MKFFRMKKNSSIQPNHDPSPNDLVIDKKGSNLELGASNQNVSCAARCCSRKNLKEQALLIATIISVALGVAVGIALRELKCSGG